MTRAATLVDVSRLPTTVFGHRSHMWWGTLGFMLIEGTAFESTISKPWSPIRQAMALSPCGVVRVANVSPSRP